MKYSWKLGSLCLLLLIVISAKAPDQKLHFKTDIKDSLPVPEFVSASDSLYEGYILINWRQPKYNESNYPEIEFNLYRSTLNDTSAMEVIQIIDNDQFWRDPAKIDDKTGMFDPGYVHPDSIYYYAVKAKIGLLESAFSKTDEGSLQRPAGSKNRYRMKKKD